MVIFSKPITKFLNWAFDHSKPNHSKYSESLHPIFSSAVGVTIFLTGLKLIEKYFSNILSDEG